MAELAFTRGHSLCIVGHTSDFSLIQEVTVGRVGELYSALSEWVKIDRRSIERGYDSRIVGSYGVIDQKRQEISLGWSLSGNDDGERVLLRSGGGLESLVQLGTRAPNLPEFVMNDKGRRQTVSCGNFSRQRAIERTQFFAVKLFCCVSHDHVMMKRRRQTDDFGCKSKNDSSLLAALGIGVELGVRSCLGTA